jgi:hypothetical protein
LIVFAKMEDCYIARVGQIELAISPQGYELTLYEMTTEYPCVYGDCPSGRDDTECPQDHVCSYAKTSEAMAASELHRDDEDFVSLAAVEKYVRRKFMRGYQGDGPSDPTRTVYPQPAAANFALEEWRYGA